MQKKQRISLARNGASATEGGHREFTNTQILNVERRFTNVGTELQYEVAGMRAEIFVCQQIFNLRNQ